MAEKKMRVFEAARILEVSESEALKLLGPQILKGAQLKDLSPGDVRRIALSGRNRMSVVDADEVDALKRRLDRAAKNTAEVRVKPTVVRRGAKVEAPPPPKVTVIKLTTDQAALLSLQELTGKEPAPARKFRVEISPPLDGLAAIDVVARQVTPEWKKGPKSEENLTDMYRAIAFGACGLLAQQREAAPKKEPDPIAERDAYMREEITVKIQTKIATAARKAVADVISGRRGYSNVLKESIPVRAHFAKYHTGKGRTEVTPILRAAHRRGGPGEKQRTYKVKA